MAVSESSSMQTKLLPCPFCGSENVGSGMGVEDEANYILCKSCLAEGPYRRTTQETIDAWNTRKTAPVFAAAPYMFRIIKRLATADWIGEKELNLWRIECREIVGRVE